MVQVENETGNWNCGARLLPGRAEAVPAPVPPEILKAMHVAAH